MADGQQQGLPLGHPPPQGVRFAGRSAFETIADLGPNAVPRFFEAVKTQLEDALNAPSVAAIVAPTTESISNWARSTTQALRRPVEFKIMPRPLWVHIVSVLAVVFLVLIMAISFASVATKTSAPPPRTLPVSFHDAPTHLASVMQATCSPEPQGQLSRSSPKQEIYEPGQRGIVAEICFLVGRASALTGCALGAQSLQTFVDSGAVGSDRSLPQRLCEACLSSSTYDAAIRKRQDTGGDNASNSAPAAAEGDGWRRMVERASILLSDQHSAEVYDSLFRNGSHWKTVDGTKERIHLLCDEFWV